MKPTELLSEYGIKGGNSHKHKWTDEERDIVRRDYDGHNHTAHLIALKLSYITGDRITFNAVKGQAAKMGILRNKSPDWTDKETELLQEMITQYSPMKIAKRLHRSLNAVVVKSKRLGLSRRFRDGWYTKRDVAEMLGVDHKKIQKYIDSGHLKAHYHTGVKPKKNGGACWHIKQEDLIRFIVNNVGDFHGRNVDLTTIVWLITGNI